ncbi:MAG: FAD-binding protein [Propionibacteriales bacterium]|nr:FAD-binding protein [Propionibacteriales bacterium]
MTAQTLAADVTGISVGSAVHDLRRTFRGAVHAPGDDEYDAQRQALNPALDPRPVVVAEASTAADVRAAVLTAREYDLPLAVQSTGHGTLVPSHGGVLLKTSRMAQVLVDPDRRIARVGPGARWSDVIAAAEVFGLAPLSGDTPSVGVVGYTLGGGLSWLSRTYGFAADSLLRAEIVTAEGRLFRADTHRNPDLFWALRGGSGNFGVVTSLEFRLYPVESVYGGVALFPIDRAADVIGHYAEHADERPDELTLSLVAMRRSPVEGVDGPVLAVRGAYAGDATRARRAMRPLWDVAGTPLVDGFRTMSYAETRTIGGTPPRQFEMFDDLPGTLIETAIDSVIREDSGVNALEIREWGGAMANPTHESPGPVGHREVPFTIKMDASAEGAAPLTAYATGGSYLNFLHDATRTHAAYTEANYPLLRDIKRAYDPDNVFRLNHNIPPSPQHRWVTAS